MTSACPICGKRFSFEIQILEHFEDHKKSASDQAQDIRKQEALLSTTQFRNQKIDKKKIFGVQRFEDSVKSRLDELDDVKEMISRRRFVEQVKNVTKRFPFLYIPSFINEWFNGATGSELIDKYLLGTHLELNYISENIFKLKNKRYTKKFPDAFKRNLKIYSWKEKYEDMENNCAFFSMELNELFFKNVLRAFILILMMDFAKEYIKKDELILQAKTLDGHYDLFHFINDDLKKTFQESYFLHIDRFAQEIIEELVVERVLVEKLDGSLQGTFSLDDIKQEVVMELELSDSPISDGRLKTIIRNSYPGLVLVPDFVIWNASLNELESDGIIKISKKTSFHHSLLIFLNSGYEKIQQQIKNLDSHRVEFYGREISPDVFINELLELEKGDIDDHDDQVTRVAGLILAESIKLLPPKEDIPEFDFATSTTSYHFRQEQLDAMKRIRLQTDSDILHYKVMIGETLSVQKHQNLKKALPDGEQGVVITFEKIPESVKQILEYDKSIQTIDMEGLKIWVAVTTKIPSRKNAVAKIHFDPISRLERRIAKINLIDYENGLAFVSVLPEMTEATVLIGSLEEIPFEGATPKTFETFASNYLEFLKILTKLTTTSNLTESIFSKKSIKVTAHPHGKITHDFEYNTASLNPHSSSKKQIISCTCLKWVEDNFYLCPHLASALNYTARTGSFLGNSWGKRHNCLQNLLEKIMEKNIAIILDRLGVYHDLDELHDGLGLQDFIFEIAKRKGNI